MENRNQVLDSVKGLIVTETIYTGVYGAIIVRVQCLDNFPRVPVDFLSVRHDGNEYTSSSLREAMNHLQIPYEDGSLAFFPKSS